MASTIHSTTTPNVALHAHQGKATPSQLFHDLNRRPLDQRAYQARIDVRLVKNWERGLKSQLVVAPTGAGKTTMALRNGRRLVREIGPAIWGCKPEEIGIFWMAMRKNLLRQTLKSNLEFYEHEEEDQYCPNLHFVSSFARTPKIGNYKHRILFCDEAHHSSTASELAVMAAINPDFTLGLSATPDRADNHQLCFQATIKDAGYRTLIKEGYLSQFRYFAMERWTPEHAVATFLHEPSRWGQSLFFFRTMEECEVAARLLTEAGFPTDICHGGVDRDSVLRPFESGAKQTLIAMAILAEGYDYPGLQTVWVRDTQSANIAVQMSGRVLRLNHGAIKNICQSVKSQHSFLREAEACEQYVQRGNEWVSVLPSLLVKQLMEDVAERMRLQLKDPVVMPDWEKVRQSLTIRPSDRRILNFDEEG